MRWRNVCIQALEILYRSYLELVIVPHALSDKSEAIRSASWFESLPEDALLLLIEAARWKSYSECEVVHAKGDEPTGVFGIFSGRLRVSQTTIKGQEVILGDLESGAWFGELTLESGTRTHNVYAKELTKILFIPKADFLNAAEQWPQLYRKLFLGMAQQTQWMMSLLEFCHTSVPLKARLAGRISYLCQTNSLPCEQGVILGAKLTQEELAFMCNGSRQHVNRILKEWSADQIIHYDRGQLIVLNQQALASEYDGSWLPDTPLGS